MALRSWNIGVAVLTLLLMTHSLTAAARDSDHHDEPPPVFCPTTVDTYVELHKSLICRDEGCNGVACDEIVLQGFEAFAHGPEDSSVETHVFRDVLLTGQDEVVWNMGDKAGGINLSRGVTVTLRDIFVEAALYTSTRLFLLPKAIEAAPQSKLVLENVTYLTSADAYDNVTGFAINNLPSDNFVIHPRANGRKSLTVSSFETETVIAKNVTIVQWSFPTADNADRLSIPVKDSHAIRDAMVNYDEDRYQEISELDVIGDVVLDPNDWPKDGLTVNRNITLGGVRSSHRSIEKVSFLDLNLLSMAVTISPGVVVTMSNLEIVNLALGPIDAHYGYLMNFFNFGRGDDDPVAIHIRDSTLVLSCPEIEHFEFAAALVDSAFSPLINNVDQLKLDPERWEVESLNDGRSGIVHVRRGRAHGISLHNVNLTCDQSHGQLIHVDFLLPSPLTFEPDQDDPVVNENSVPETESESEVSSTMFKILLGVLVPMVVILSLLLFWKVRRRKTGGKTASTAKLKQPNDIEHGESVRDLVDEVGDKAMKHSITDSFEQDRLDKLPSTRSPDKLNLAAGSLKLSAAELGASQAAEFIPDILAVSEEIDDKQLIMKDLLSQGQNATVHKGIWRELDVAVKTIIFRGEHDSKDYHQRAIREVAITSGLAHPNVVCTYSYDIKRLQAGSMEARLQGLKRKSGVNVLDSCVDWKLFIIQEFCEMGTLHSALQQRAFVDERTGNPDLESLLEIASGMVKGMHHIHSKNIIHGNLKPSNVLLKSSPDTHTKMAAKIADFGLSLKMNLDQTHVSNAELGTSFYMAREVVEKGSASKAADVYAFGVILWEMYTSQLSHTGQPNDEMKALFPRLPWSCPAPYGVLAIACMHPVPSARPTFNDVLELLWLMWRQLPQGTLTPPPVASVRSRSRTDCKDLCHGFKCMDPPSGRGLLQPDPETEKISDRRRKYFWKSLASVPEMFKSIEYEQVYWPETDPDGGPLSCD